MNKNKFEFGDRVVPKDKSDPPFIIRVMECDDGKYSYAEWAMSLVMWREEDLERVEEFV